MSIAQRWGVPLGAALMQAAVCVVAAPVLPAAPVAAVQWVQADSAAALDAAFATARRQGRPLYLYWGAQWCPPCNQVKATVFKRADFIDLSRRFVAVQLDGDAPGAQKLGARFKVSAYPTMVLFSPQGQELTRLPGEVDAPVILRALASALAGGPPVRQLLQAARAGQPLDDAQWRQLAWYAWDVDEQQLLPRDQQATVLAQLAEAAEAASPAAAVRLRLKAVVALADAPDAKPLDDDARFAAGAGLLRLLGDADAAREQTDLLAFSAKELVGALGTPGSPQRAQLVAAWDQAARRLQADATLSRADRLGALYARVMLARLDEADDARARVPADLQAEVLDSTARHDRELDDAAERQSVITLAAALLRRAGLLAESDALLKANLSRSHSPYYLMSQLAGNARARGDHDEALRWYQRAWEASRGPATRTQWGAGYLGALLDLSPRDEARIEAVAGTLLRELAGTRDAFHERNARTLERIGRKLKAWSEPRSGGAAVLARLQRRLAPVCAQLRTGDPQRAACEKVL